MSFITASGERLPLKVVLNGVESCRSFMITEGQTVGEAVMQKGHDCPFCNLIRNEILEDGWEPTKIPPGYDPVYA